MYSNPIARSGLCVLLFAAAMLHATAAEQHEPAMSMAPTTLNEWARGAELQASLGDVHRQISTRVPAAQRYFDQGMALMWAFNHDESARSFARAAELDPRCGICLWGFALTVGSNYNIPSTAEVRAKVAFETLQRALQLETAASPVEKALIEALRARYSRPIALDPSNEGPVLSAYASAMGRVAEQYPEDSDVQAMFAESLLNTNAWKLWSPDGKPRAGTEEIVATLETVLARDPSHPGANRCYVHVIEASRQPEKAIVAAERLSGMMPAADRAYLSATQPLDYYPMYLAHNYQFLAFSAAMEGRREEALVAAQRSKDASAPKMRSLPGMEWYATLPYFAMVRFAAWDQILTQPAPDPAFPGWTGGYLAAKAMALAATGRVPEARRTWEELEKARSALGPDRTAGTNLTANVLALASAVARAKIAAAEHSPEAAIQALTEAVKLEDRLVYDEPSEWFFPVRHLLGAALLAVHRDAQAEAVYREDLRRHPDNGWSLFGLAQALQAQHKEAEAQQVEARFRTAWRYADVRLTSSQLY